MDIQLREGEFNAMGLEGLPQRDIDGATDIGQPVFRIGDPETQVEIDRAGAIGHQIADRRLVGDHPLDAQGRLDGDALHLFDIVRAIADAERGVHAHGAVGFRPVDDTLDDEALIGNQHFRAVAGADRDIARLHLGDPAECAVNLERIARLDRFVGQQGETRGEVGDGLLQAEADTDTDRPGEDRQRGDIETGQLQRDQQGCDRQHEAEHFGDQGPEGRGDLFSLLQLRIDGAPGQRGEPEQGREIDHGAQYVEQAQIDRRAIGGLPQRDRQRLQLDDDIVEQAEHVERGNRPDHIKRDIRPEFRADDQRHGADHQPGGHQAHRGIDQPIGPLQTAQHDADNRQHHQKGQRRRQRQRRRQQAPRQTGTDTRRGMVLDQPPQSRPEHQGRNDGRRDQSDLQRDIQIEHGLEEPVPDGQQMLLQNLDRHQIVQGRIVLCLNHLLSPRLTPRAIALLPGAVPAR